MAWDISWHGTRKMIWKSFLAENTRSGLEKGRLLNTLHQEDFKILKTLWSVLICLLEVCT